MVLRALRNILMCIVMKKMQTCRQFGYGETRPRGLIMFYKLETKQQIKDSGKVREEANSPTVDCAESSEIPGEMRRGREVKRLK